VKRLLKDYQGAIRDFVLAYDHLDSSDRVSLMVVFFVSLSFITFNRLEKFVFFLSTPFVLSILETIMKLSKRYNKLKHLMGTLAMKK
jgi:hypothetical protein